LFLASTEFDPASAVFFPANEEIKEFKSELEINV